MNPRPLRLLLAAAALTLAGLCYADRQARDGDMAARAHASGQLREVLEADAALDLETLRVRIGLAPHYDAVIEAAQRLEGALAALQGGPVAATAAAEPRVQAALAALDESLRDKVGCVEDIKSTSAVLRNSESYLPAALREAEDSAGPAAALLGSALMSTLLAPSSETEDGLRRVALDLSIRRGSTPELASAAVHARLVLENRAALAGLSARYLAVPSRARARAVADAYVEETTRVDGHRELFRLLLYGASFALFAFAAWTGVGIMRLNAAARRFVPFQFLDLLGKRSIAEIQSGDSVQQEVTVLFCDIRGFTTACEQRSPADSFRFINEYLTKMEGPILEHRGFVNQFLGDGIVALFPRSPEDAVSAAVAMIRALERLNASRTLAGLDPIRIGIGVNTGPLILGTIGGPDRMDCGVIGSAVNLAARVEGLTRLYRAAILITASTRDRLQDPHRFSLRFVDRVRPAGISRPITLFEVLDAEPEDARRAKLETQGSLRSAIDLYRSRHFSAARELLEVCLVRAPRDGLLSVYLDRCRRLGENPPPPDWDGVVSLDMK